MPNVHDDDEETLLFADESEYIDDEDNEDELVRAGMPVYSGIHITEILRDPITVQITGRDDPHFGIVATVNGEQNVIAMPIDVAMILSHAIEHGHLPNYEEQAQPGPGQAEDNIVHQLTCGHEYDDVEQLDPGTIVRCSVHGKVYVTDGRGNDPGTMGTTVIQSHDDSPCPLTGIVTGRVDDDRVVVVWGDAVDLTEATEREGRIEWLDQLTPRNR